MMVVATLLSINQSSYHMAIDTTNDSWRALRLVRLPLITWGSAAVATCTPWLLHQADAKQPSNLNFA
ncbi:hypothetical protein F2P45_33405 [Massilia sp. CCM 8733]|uniref:Uncharacterized protein n=1 Tax=Massilia mucilaginosa TaxID=2609282 RepID=A0ABX0P4X2_9BURK|nr:hypothetical protein [Massilia mucilaginosa]NHZ93860.1 hypothetical protein [Massilia mucilaginosa]